MLCWSPWQQLGRQQQKIALCSSRWTELECDVYSPTITRRYCHVTGLFHSVDHLIDIQKRSMNHCSALTKSQTPFRGSQVFISKWWVSNICRHCCKERLGINKPAKFGSVTSYASKIKAPQSWQTFADVCMATGKFVPLTIQTAVKFRDFEEPNLR